MRSVIDYLFSKLHNTVGFSIKVSEHLCVVFRFLRHPVVPQSVHVVESLVVVRLRCQLTGACCLGQLVNDPGGNAIELTTNGFIFVHCCKDFQQAFEVEIDDKST